MHRHLGRVHGDGGHGLQAGKHQRLILIGGCLETNALTGNGTGGEPLIRPDDPGDPVGRGIEDGQAQPVAAEGEQGVPGAAQGGITDAGNILPRLFVDPGNGRAGQNIMELIDQEQLPGFLQRRGRIFRPAGKGGHGGEHFPHAQDVLRPAVPLFDQRLGGIGSPVAGEIQLPAVNGQGSVVPFFQVIRRGHPV